MDTTSSIQKVVGDIVDLCELQMQLLSVDSQAAKRKLTRAIACGTAAATLAGSALTVVLVGLGFVIDELTDLSTGAGLLIVGAATFAIVIALLVVSLIAVRAAAAAMSESTSEFAENLRWLKATLVSPQTSPRNRMRRETFPDVQEQDPGARYQPHSVTPLSRR